MIHVPEQPKHDDNPFVIIAGLLLLIVIGVGLWVGLGALTETTETTEPFDTTGFCEGFINGVAYGVYSATGDISMAVAVAATETAPQCDPSKAARLPADESFCEGMAYGYLETGRALGWGEPPQGAAEFIAASIGECLAAGVPANPIIPRTIGGGPPPADS